MTLERKIVVYSFGNKNEVRVIPTGQTLTTNPELTAFIEEAWKPKAEKGRKNSWIPVVTKIHEPFVVDITGKSRFDIEAGAMTYAQTHGILQAIKKEKSFAPKAIHNLSIGVIPVTNDGYLLISRRNPKIEHAGGVWNFNGGYMASLLIDRENCSDESFKDDKRLFNIRDQLERRIHRQEFYGLAEDELKITGSPNALAFGFYHSLEMELGWVVRFKKSREELQEHIREYEIQGQKEHTETVYLAIEDLDELLLNQGELLNENPRTYTTQDPKKVILLDDNIGELMGGAYFEIMNRPYYLYDMKYKFFEPLEKKGLKINLKTEFPYSFPTGV